MRQFGFWALAMLLCAQPLLSCRAATVHTRRATIHCGSKIFVAHTSTGGLGALSQRITAFDGKEKGSALVDLRESTSMAGAGREKRAELTSFISAWQCRKTSIGPVLILFYDCNLEISGRDMDRVCGPTKEWLRYVGGNGELLDRGFLVEDPRYEKLRWEMGYRNKPDEAFDEGPFSDID